MVKRPSHEAFKVPSNRKEAPRLRARSYSSGGSRSVVVADASVGSRLSFVRRVQFRDGPWQWSLVGGLSSPEPDQATGQTRPAGQTRAGSQPRRDSPNERNPPDEQDQTSNRGANNHHRTAPTGRTTADFQPRRLFSVQRDAA